MGPGGWDDQNDSQGQDWNYSVTGLAFCSGYESRAEQNLADCPASARLDLHDIGSHMQKMPKSGPPSVREKS